MSAILLICATLAFSDGDSGWCHREDGSRVKVRLAGVDAGEVRPYTRCRRSPRVWACSQIAREFAPVAAARARELAKEGAVCAATDKDRYRRDVATCKTDDGDIAATLVREGLAISETNYGDPYRSQEAEARRARLGVWR